MFTRKPSKHNSSWSRRNRAIITTTTSFNSTKGTLAARFAAVCYLNTTTVCTSPPSTITLLTLSNTAVGMMPPVSRNIYFNRYLCLPNVWLLRFSSLACNVNSDAHIYYSESSQMWRRNDSEQIGRTKSNIVEHFRSKRPETLMNTIERKHFIWF